MPTLKEPFTPYMALLEHKKQALSDDNSISLE